MPLKADAAGITRYVTMAYGGQPAVYRQSVMMLLSLVAFAPEPYELVVATDRPEDYVWFGTRVDIQYLDPSLLEAWKGPRPFSMRQKLMLLRTAWPESGAIALLDADVLATTDLRPFVRGLQDGALFMHRREYEPGKTRRPGHRQLWKTLRRTPLDGYTPSAGDAMWNSGVIAAPAADRVLLDQAIALYDEMDRRGFRHFVAEQLAEGLVFGRTGRLQPAEAWFAHYWGNRAAYDAEIARRLSEAFLEGLSVKDAAAAYARRPIDFPVEVRRTRGQKLRRWLFRERTSGSE
jgi:hypothetical protein